MLCGLPILSVLNVFNRTPVPTENKTKNLKLNQFAVLLGGGGMAEPMAMPFPATSSSSRYQSVCVSLVLLRALVLLCLDFNHKECSLQSSRRNSFVVGLLRKSDYRGVPL